MKTIYKVTGAVKETKHCISVLCITETSTVRTLSGSIGSTFSDIEECTGDDFMSWLPHDTAKTVMSFTKGTYSFDSTRGQWVRDAEASQQP